MKNTFLGISFFIFLFTALAGLITPEIYWSLVLTIPLFFLGLRDMLQTKKTILRNFPVLGHFRYIFETIRPEINQYFVESNSDGRPFSREERSIVYQRAKGARDTLPFGTQKDVYEVGYEWVNHSLATTHLENSDFRVLIGPKSQKPYLASLLNISAMSYRALSKNAILALNKGAHLGGFAHNTGEGGLSPYHIEGGGDLIWQIGTGYFGCRDEKGNFSKDLFQEQAQLDQVKMIELKLSQGAKPGHGGILPAAKLTPEIAKIRKVQLGQDVISPSRHTAFSTPIGLLQFIQQLRENSGGKPVGFKLCMGNPWEFLAICKAMIQTGIQPDFITVDGGEGGTGAAPLEFSNHVGTPLREGLLFAHNSLQGFGLRKQIRLIASGRVITGFGLIKRLALGADACYSARGMMMALGCIQALRCDANVCPAGVATSDPKLFLGLDVTDKSHRVFAYHKETLRSTLQLLESMGLTSPSQVSAWNIMKRISHTEVKNYGELYRFLADGELIESPPAEYLPYLRAAHAESFSPYQGSAIHMSSVS